MKKVICLLLGAVLVAAADEVRLPGEDGTHEAVTCAPFPDALSAYVWRNWPVVSVDRLADAIGASRADLEGVAAEMGLPVPQPAVSPLWRRKGYITVVRRNWHLLPYEQLLKVVDMTRAELAYSLTEDDFLFVKLGNTKPLCPPITYSPELAAKGRARRLEIARTLKEEGIVPMAPEEPRFSFVGELSKIPEATGVSLPRTNAPRGSGALAASTAIDSPFDLRLIFSYFADYGDPLGDDEVGSYPEGLLARLAANGVNAVWLHTVLSTLARDPAYPEFGEGSERRIANLRKLVARAAKYGIKVYLYVNEPRAQDDAFFEKPGRMETRGAKRTHDGLGYARCTSCPETRRWLRGALQSVFSQVPGLGGIFTITMSENLTNCASRGGKNTCSRCKDRTVVDIVAEVNRTISEGVKAGDQHAEVICWDWGWPMKDRLAIAERLPPGCRVMTVSERGVPTNRGGVKSTITEYSLSAPGPSDAARELWTAAKGRGLKTAAKVQAALTWEMSAVPYVPVMDLVAEHVRNLAESGVDGVMLSWSLGSAPTPNLSIFADYRRGEGTGPVLDRLAERLYGKDGVPAARAAWKAYSDGFREYPFYISSVYAGNHTVGPANPLYIEQTYWPASMVGIPYDDLRSWRSIYPEEVYLGQMEKVRDGFVKGNAAFASLVASLDGDRQAAARRELGLFRAIENHFRSVCDQIRFVRARTRGDRDEMLACARRELETAKRHLALVRADSRIGYECSNHYYYLPHDLIEKILNCRDVARAAATYEKRVVTHVDAQRTGGPVKFDKMTSGPDRLYRFREPGVYARDVTVVPPARGPMWYAFESCARSTNRAPVVNEGRIVVPAMWNGHCARIANTGTSPFIQKGAIETGSRLDLNGNVTLACPFRFSGTGEALFADDASGLIQVTDGFSFNGDDGLAAGVARLLAPGVLGKWKSLVVVSESRETIEEVVRRLPPTWRARSKVSCGGLRLTVRNVAGL